MTREQDANPHCGTWHPDHTCRPDDSPGVYLAPEVAAQINRPWQPPARLRPFTCSVCGRSWKVSGMGWAPVEEQR